MRRAQEVTPDTPARQGCPPVGQPRRDGVPMDRSGLTLGVLAGLVGIACCASPVALVLLGLSSVSFALSLGNTLYYEYGWYFRGAAILLAAAGVVGILRGRKSCSLRGLREQWRLLFTVILSMVLIYAVLYWLTSYLARIAA